MKQLLLITAFALQTMIAGAQSDTVQWQSNLISDFNTADLVALVKTESCSIVDTIGSYTSQKVVAKIIRCYKGCPAGNRVTYHGFVETHKQWLPAGNVRGVFLIAGYRQDTLTYGWLENSGFPADDTGVISCLANTDTLYDKLAANMALYDEKPLWVKATLQSIRSSPSPDDRRTATIVVTTSISAPGLIPGRSYHIGIHNPVFESLHFQSKLRPGTAYYFPLFRDDQQQYYSHTELILPRLSPSMIRKLQQHWGLCVTNNKFYFTGAMKWIPITLLCLLSMNGFCQKRAAIFNFDLKGNPHQLKPADFHIHVHEVPDRTLYTDSSGEFSYAKFTEANAGKLDTQLTMNADFAFRLKDLKTGTLYSVSIYYNIPLDTFNRRYVYRTRAAYQELRLNSWTYEYRLQDNSSCNYDQSLKNRQCPKCHRKDHVLPVIYGLSVADPAAPAPYPVKGFDAGTDITGCDPNWYCERDKLRF